MKLIQDWSIDLNGSMEERGKESSKQPASKDPSALLNQLHQENLELSD